MKKLRNMLCSGISSAMLLSALPVHAANMVTTTFSVDEKLILILYSKYLQRSLKGVYFPRNL